MIPNDARFTARLNRLTAALHHNGRITGGTVARQPSRGLKQRDIRGNQQAVGHR